jgi:predicted permease
MAAGLGGALVLSVVLSVPVIWFHLHSQSRIGLRGETRGGPAGRSVQRLRHGFLVAQIALACVLLASAGLLGISLKRVSETPTGFRTEQVYTGGLALGWTSYHKDASRLAFVERLLGELHRLPGVGGAAVTNGLPFAGLPAQQAIAVEGQPAGAGQPAQIAFVISEAGDYWKTIGVPLLHGRFLAESDNRSERLVCVIDQAVAERYWPNSDPLGRRLSVSPVFDPAHAATIVGVVATTKQDALTERTAVGTVVFPYAMQKPFAISLIVRASPSPALANSLVRGAVRRLDPELVIDDFRTLQSRIDESLVVWRSPTILAGFFAGLALLLSAIGTYGVLSFSVMQRRSEIGVRMALGAAPSRVARQFLGVGLRLFFQGSVAGIIGAWSVSRAMQGLLFGVDATSPIVLLATVAAIGAITMVACLLPARRAAKIDPAVALRAE